VDVTWLLMVVVRWLMAVIIAATATLSVALIHVVIV
jgi:hypothetical protein